MGAILVKSGNHTIPASAGNVAITGVGFQPKVLIWRFSGRTADFTSGGNYYPNIGVGISSTERGLIFVSSFDNKNPTITRRLMMNDQLCTFRWTDAPLTRILLDLVSMDADGFTYNISTADTSVRLCNYLAIGGDIGTPKLLELTGPTTAGIASFTGAGFSPNAVMLLSTGQTSAYGTIDNNAVFSYGWCARSHGSGTNNNMVLAMADVNGVTPSNVTHYLSQSHCLANIDPANTASFTSLAKYSSMDADGFSLNFEQAPATGEKFLALCLDKGAYQFGRMTITDDENTNWPWTQVWTPVGNLACFNNGRTTLMTDATPEAHANCGMGFAGNVVTNESSSGFYSRTGLATSDSNSRQFSNRIADIRTDSNTQLNSVDGISYNASGTVQLKGVVNSDFNLRYLYFLLIGDERSARPHAGNTPLVSKVGPGLVG